MSTQANAIFIAVFLLVIVVISWWDTGSIAWPVVLGGAFGAAIGLAAVSVLRRRRQPPGPGSS